MQRRCKSPRCQQLALIVAAAWAFILPLVTRAVAQVSQPVPPLALTTADEPPDSVGAAWSLGSITPRPEGSQPLFASAMTGSDPPRSFLDVAYQSLFGDAYSEAARASWRPLRLGTFFTEGWNEPYVDAPAGSGGAPRSGWVNSFEGTFFRACFLSLSFASQGNLKGNDYFGDFTIYAPLNRRFELRVDVPFIASTKGGATDTYHDRFGDMVISPRFVLTMTQDFSQLLAINVRTPTGSQLNGNGVDSVSPHYQFWGNPYGNWAVRGGTGVTVATNGVRGDTFYFANLGVGHHWKGADASFIQHQWLTLVANFDTSRPGGIPGAAYLSVTPGYRAHFLDVWSILAGLEVPLTTHSPFAAAPIFLLLREY